MPREAWQMSEEEKERRYALVEKLIPVVHRILESPSMIKRHPDGSTSMTPRDGCHHTSGESIRGDGKIIEASVCRGFAYRIVFESEFVDDVEKEALHNNRVRGDW